MARPAQPPIYVGSGYLLLFLLGAAANLTEPSNYFHFHYRCNGSKNRAQDYFLSPNFFSAHKSIESFNPFSAEPVDVHMYTVQ